MFLMYREFYIRIVSGEAKGLTPALCRAVLSILSALYFLAWAARQAVFSLHILRPKQVSARVVSIGNITAGGTGKTPAAMYFARKIGQDGSRIAVISRGYGRRSPSDEPVIVSDAGGNLCATPEQSGDEPYLMARKLSGIPVVVCGNRVRAAALAIERFSVEVILLDDGFQHRRIARNEDIVVVDCTEPFGHGHLLPRGLLREPLGSLRRASLFLLTHADQEKHFHVVERLKEINPSAEILITRHQPVRLLSQRNREQFALDLLGGKKVLAVSSIGNPLSFEKSLEQAGAILAGSLRFPDHHWYSPTDAEQISREARGCNADYIVTTEKDGVRLDLLEETPANLLLLEVELEVIGRHPVAE